MKKEIFNYIRSRAFRNYLFSFVGIFVIILSLVSIVAMRYAADNMKKENIRVMESKLYTIAEDLEIQTESMWRIAMEVASRNEFRMDYLESGKYKEIELLERLVGYKQILDICDGYFLKFDSANTIFSSTGTTMPLRFHLSTVFGKDEYDEAMELIEGACDESELPLILYKRGDVTLFIYPLNTYALGENGRNGILCFQVSEEKLQERKKKTVGIMEGTFSIYYNGFCLLGENVEIQKDTLVKISQANHYSIYFNMDKDSYFSWNNVWSGKMGLAFVAAAILLFALGIIVACWNFRPLRQITEKYKSRAGEELTADWDSIDALLESFWRGKETNSKLLQAQYRVLREQTIQLLASGGYSEKVQEHMELLNIKLNAGVYGIIRCSFEDKQKLKEYWEDMYKDIEDLSGDGENLYSYWDSNSDLRVLAAVEEEYQLEEVVELLQSLFEAKALTAEIVIRAISHDLKSFEKREENKEQGTVDADAAESSRNRYAENLTEKNSMAGTVVEYIRTNCTDYNLSLDLLAQEFQITPQYLCKIIKQQTGISYKEYLTGLRMEEAKRLLKEKNISVIDACQQSGYNNVSYFIKVFQKYTGETPAKYRDEH